MQKFFLKPMVVARLLAEISALTILLFLPWVLLLNGQMGQAALHARLILFGLSVVALVMIPAYGFITFEVVLDKLGLTARSLFRRSRADYAAITALKLTTSWGFRRYVVKCKDGDVSFPVWINGVKDLATIIRLSMPAAANLSRGGATGGDGGRTYSADLINLIIQVGQLLLNLGFIAVFWMFFASLRKQSSASDPLDAWIILAACVILTLIMLLRACAIAMMPNSVTVGADALTLKTVFGRRQIAWGEVTAITPPFAFLPAGLLVRTQKKGWFLIGEQLEAIDELEEDLFKKVPFSTNEGSAKKGS